ncbi:MAG: RluA family pseudouridine synthase [Candidatus Paceibacterota bacterium]
MADLIDIKIIYEDDDTLVIDKPAGIRVHDDGFGRGPTVVDWLVAHYPALQEVGESMTLPGGEKIDRPGIVHRLDRDTSGLLLIAKTPSAFIHLKKQFKDRLVKKTYLALLSGKMNKEGKQVIDLPIGRSSRDPRIRVASQKAKGKLRPAETSYQILKHYHGYTLVEASPRTGRTHQLRAHFKAISHPIVGDGLYNKNGGQLAGLKRQALHAHQLTVCLPSGEEKTFVSPLSADFQSALDNLALA